MIDETDPTTPRLVQRFRNFDGALMRLREGIEMVSEDPDVHSIVKEGLIQRFEFTFELAWKTLKDYLVFRKVTLERSAAADVIKVAFATGYLKDGETWMDALDARNEMSHVYRQQSFERVTEDIQTRFINVIEDLHEMLMMERARLAGF
ncbi:nucleotidyltransferase substrate binding protein [Sphingomonas sp.]|uniref:nucleotidyltransferase substrate binding protein n=1 Tax=Sphingomonas sp. TaxID=28214 RepID=UPI002D805740|nr:nucleotidyltransferase substrate binding protein [Sphingomonas sp.]HEU0043745.1 nucleotidyltransferase substrate binding protein [Sphingomonas sp.]